MIHFNSIGNLFGAQSKPTTSLFGQQTTTQPTSIFGSTATTANKPLFGATSTTTNSSFGSTGFGGFGSTTQTPTTSIFGTVSVLLLILNIILILNDQIL